MRIRCLGQSEVEYFDLSISREFYVRGLQIAVNDALMVGGAERLCDLERNRQRFVNGDRPLRDAIGERRPFDELEDEGAYVGRVLLLRPAGHACFFEAVDRRNVRMIERREHLRFALEAREAIGLCGKQYFPEPLIPNP